MKANGFTLIEILGVVVILSLIAILAFPSIVENIRKSEAQLNKASMLLIESAVDIYMDNNKSNYPDIVGTQYCINLENLVESGNLRNPFIDTSTGKEIDINDKAVEVIIKETDNEYKIKDSKCSELEP